MPYRKFRQSSIVFEKTGILPEKLKTWRAPATMNFNNFCQNFADASQLPMPTKVCSGLFLFRLDLELFAKIKNNVVATHSQKPGLSITQDLNKI